MKKEARKVSGTAYLTGSEKTTNDLVNSLAEAVGALHPDIPLDKFKTAIMGKLVIKFDEQQVFDIPETLDEAVDMLPNGRESMTKMVISKALTNQQDKARQEIIDDLVKGKDIKTIMAGVIKEFTTAA